MSQKKIGPKTAGAATSASQSNGKVAPEITLSEAQRLAAMILECLAGVRAPPSAAEVLGISLPRYYQLEARALEGLVAALAPRAKGKQPSLESRVKSLEKELQAAQRAAARQEALVRLTQRSLGLAALTKTPATSPPSQGKRRKRRPAVRALRAAKTLQAKSQTPAETAAETATQSGAGNPVAAEVQTRVPSDTQEVPA